jgi:hypothetical protein
MWASKEPAAGVELFGIRTPVPLWNAAGLPYFNEGVPEFPFLKTPSPSGN